LQTEQPTGQKKKIQQDNQTLEFISGYRDLETKKDTTEGTAWEIDHNNYKRKSI
jgi:hypothetical protein